MRRIVLWGLSTLSVVVLLFGYSTSTSGPTVGAESAFVSTTSAGTSTGTTGSPGTSGSTDSTAVTTSTVTGDVTQTRWGPVQVELTLAGTQITKVEVLQYPQGNDRDQEINNRALPVLIEETMSAQSAGIDMVSGATYTSQGYLESLQSALDQT